MDTKKKTVEASILADEAIIDMYWGRNERAIEETDKKYGRYLYTIAYNILRDTLDCEECLNDTYLKTWNRIPPTRPNVFQVFLSKITRDVSVDKYRQNHSAKKIPTELVRSLDELEDCLTTNTSVEEEVLVRQMIAILNSYLESLSSRDEFCFICRYYYSDSIEEIARMLKLSERTVFRDLSRIRKGLRERLEKEGFIYE